MSFTPVAQSGKPRPNVVTYAVWVMWAVVGLHVLQVLLSFVPTPELDRKLDEFYQAHPELGQGETAAALLNIGVEVAIIAAFAALAIFVGRGSQPARIVTWVLSGIFVLCLGCGLAFSFASMNEASPTATPAPTATSGGSSNTELVRELSRIYQEYTPGWYTPLANTLTVVNTLAMVAVIILLALPAANEYFRREAPAWVPPTARGGTGLPPTPPPSVPPKE